jgi:UDP-N-acetylmuramyl pentapeptide synthase
MRGAEGTVRMTAADVARVVGGEVEGNAAVQLIGAEVDSRRLEDGDLFVALSGARTDGHEFVGVALQTAAAALVCRDVDLEAPPPERALVRVDDSPPTTSLPAMSSESIPGGWPR